MDIIINDNEETVTCRICGEQCKRIYGKHLKFKHNNLTTKEYKEMFPGAPIMAKGDLKNTSKNSGKHMKTEKYKKMFSEMFSGKNNPNHKSNSTEQERKERSPSCIEFYEKNYPELTDQKRKKMLNDHIVYKNKDRVLTSHVEYWTRQGYSEEEAKLKVSERQRTFSKDICIEKYGEVDGLKIWKDRQENWQKSLYKNGNIKGGYSKVSQELFKILDSRIDGDFKYATKGKGEFCIRDKNNYFYDFTDTKRMKIIEYNGDQYHANPKIYEADDFPHPYRKEKGFSSKDIWEMDKIKKEVANKNGYDVLYIWDSEYRKVSKERKDKIIQKCIYFLMN